MSSEKGVQPLITTDQLLHNALEISVPIPELLGVLRWMEGNIDPDEPFSKLLYPQYFALLETIKTCCNRDQATRTLGNTISLLARTNLILQVVLPEYYKLPLTPEEKRIRDNLMSSTGITQIQSAEVPKSSKTDS